MFRSLVSIGFVTLVAASNVAAQDLTLRVRVIRAQKMSDESADRSHVSLDGRIQDLESKLKSLPYEEFSLVKDIARSVKVKDKFQLDLCKKQVLHARVLYRDGDRVGLWLRWNDKEGEPLIDTRLHVDIDQAMLVGSEEDVKHIGKVLAISLSAP